MIMLDFCAFGWKRGWHSTMERPRVAADPIGMVGVAKKSPEMTGFVNVRVKASI